MPRNVLSRHYLLRMFLAAMLSAGGLAATGAPMYSVALAATSSTNSQVGYGSTGSSVKQVQTHLNDFGFNSGPVDGIFGPKTLKAVKAFQKAKHLAVDGIVGPHTWGALTKSKSTNPSMSSSEVRYGSRGSFVTQLQSDLNKLGYNCGPLDGIFGPNTLKAVKAFQTAKHIAVDGIVGPQTWGALTSTHTTTPSRSNSEVRYGSNGSFVKQLQTDLRNLGYNCGPVDGQFGSKTLQAVKAFQRTHHLAADGIVGPKTWAALDSNVAQKSPVVLSKNETYGPGSGQASVTRNIMVVSNARLQNLAVKGTIYVNPGPNGTVVLDNVTVSDAIVIESGADKSIHLENVQAPTLTVESTSPVHIVAQGSTHIQHTQISTQDKKPVDLDQSGGTLGSVTVSSTQGVTLAGSTPYSNVEVSSSTTLTVSGTSQIQALGVSTSNAKIAVSNGATVMAVNVTSSNANGISIVNDGTISSIKNNSSSSSVAVSGSGKVSTVSGNGVTTNAATPMVTGPSSQTVNVGGTAKLAITASVSDGGTLSYQWYKNSTNSTSGGTVITGATTATYAAPTNAAGTTYYYCVVTNSNNSDTGSKTATASSGVATVTVNALTNAATPTVSGPSSPTVSVGGTANLAVTASVSDGGTLSYQWYKNTTNSPSGGTAISGATSSTYAAPTSAAGTTYYYCVVTNTNSSDTGNKTATVSSGVATVTVNALTNVATPTVSGPSSQTVSVGGTASLTVTASVGGGGTLSYQWYKNSTASTTSGTAITGATSATYTAPTSTAGTTYYYCVVTDTNSSDTGSKTATASSSVATVTVNALTDAATPTLTGPSSQTVNVGSTANLAVTASVSDGGTLSYQWYKNTTNSPSGGTAISGATTATYAAPTSTAGTTYYYCVVTNTNSSDTGNKTATTSSGVAKVTVNALTNAATPTVTGPSSQTVNVGGTASLAVTASVSDGGTLSYQWYKNTTNSPSGGTAISGATTATYAVPTSAAGTTYYYCVVTNTNSSDTGNKTATASSGVAKVTVNALTDAATPTVTGPSSQTVNVGGTASLAVTASVSDGGTLSYQWYKNTTNSNSGGSAITGATTATYAAPTSSAGTMYYYCVVTNTNNSDTGNETAMASSEAAAVTVNALTSTGTPTGISGTVSDTSGLVSGAEVTVTDSVYGNVWGSATTNSSGNYSISDLPPGTYSVTAGDGYLGGTIVYVPVTQGHMTTGKNLTLTQINGQIIGKVIDGSTAEPVSGAWVFVYDRYGNEVTSTQTGSDGSYSFSVPAGTYSITAGDGYLGGTTTSVTVTQGQTTSGKDFTLTKANGQIKGMVTDGSTNQPASAAWLTIYDSNGNQAGRTQTGTDGTYSFSVPAGTYTIQADYTDANNNVETADSSSVTVAVGADSTENLTVLATGISGTVTGPNGPVSGAQVSVTDSVYGGVYNSFTTDSSGNYSVSALSPGTYTVTVNDGYLGGSLSSVTVAQGHMTTGKNLVLTQSNGQIIGKIIDGSTGDPASNAWITVNDSNWNQVGSARTGSDGSYSFSLPAGTYSLYVNYTAANGDYEEATSPSVTVAVGADSTENLTVVATGISGTVSDSNGPVSGAQVFIVDSSGNEAGTATTDSSGSYSVTGLAPDTYTVSAADGYLGATLTGVAVTKGHMAADQNLDLTQTNGKITGTITDSSTGNPAGDAFVTLVDSSGHYVRNIRTASDGTYDFSVSAGTYTVKAAYTDTNNDFETATSTPLTVTVGANSTESLSVTPTAISGTISGPDGPLSGAKVFVTDGNWQGWSTTTDSSGRYFLANLSPGTYTLTASDGYLGGALPDIIVTQSQTTTGEDVKLTQTNGQIVGTVSVASTGQPVGGVSVTLLDSSGSYVLDTEAASDGTFTFSVPAGTYTAEANYMDANGIPETATTAPIMVTVGADSTESLALAPTGISGTVSGPNGPISGVQVSVTGSDGSQWTADTDSSGNYSVYGLPAGTFTVTVADGYLGGTLSDLMVTEGHMATGKNLALSQINGQISGTFTDGSTGQPASNAWVTLYNSNGADVEDTKTGSNGTYSFYALPGTYTVKMDLTDTNGDQETAISPPVTVTVGADSTVANLTVVATGISGTISGPNGPVSGAGVTVVDGNGSPQATVFTDGSGHYSVSDLSSGTYRLDVSDGYLSGSVSSVSVIQGKMTTGTNLTLTQVYGEISGTITDGSTGGPASYAMITVLNSSGNQVDSTQAASDGSFTLYELGGTYTLIVDSAGGVAEHVISDPVTVTVGTNSTENLTVVATGISGTVTGPNGPVSGAQIFLTDSNGSGEETTTDSSGNYSFSGLLSGTYTVTASDGYLVGTLSNVSLTQGQTLTDKNLTLVQSNGEISGTVTDGSTGQPASEAWVQVYDSTGKFVGNTQTGSDGSYTFSAPPGAYTVDANYTDASGDNETATSPSITVTVGVTSTEDLAVTATGISGTVTGPDGPLNGAQVTLTDSNGEVQASMTTDDSGHYAVSQLAPGTYTVTASDGYLGGSLSSILVTQDKMSTGEDLTLTQSNGQITGTVTDGSTRTLASNAWVTLRDSSGNYAGSAVTGSDGSYSLSAPAGTYTVEANYTNNGATETATSSSFTVTVGANSTQDLTVVAPSI